MTNPSFNEPTEQIHPREKLIQTASRLVHQQGWTATGINQILLDAGIPKGSFYYYFRSKEALGVAVLQAHFATLKNLVHRTLLNAQLSGAKAIEEFMSEVVDAHRNSQTKLGCPIGSFANEVATQSAMLLDEANQAFRLMEDSMTHAIQRGQRDGTVRAELEPVEFARTTAMLLEGAYLSSKSANSIAPLELARRVITQQILAPAQNSPVKLDYQLPQALAS